MDTFEISTDGSDPKPLHSHSDSKILKMAERFGVNPDRCADYVRMILTILPVIFFICCIIIVGLRSKLITQTRQSTPPLSTTLLTSIQYINTQGYIVGITERKETEKCPSGYEEGDFGMWVGVQPGCISAENSRLLPASECKDTDTKIEGVASQPIKTWKGLRFCFKRIPRSEVVYRLTGTCEKGMRECAQRYCVPEKYECPISWFSTEIVDYADPYATHTSPGTRVVYSINDYIPGKKLVFYYAPDMEKVLTGFEVTYAKRTCWDLYDIDGSPEANDGTERTVYPLLRAQPKRDRCGGYSYRNDVVRIDSTDELDFYKDNSFASLDKMPRIASYAAGKNVHLTARFAPLTMPTNGCWDIDFGTVGSMKSKLELFNKLSFLFYYIDSVLFITISCFIGYNLFKAIQLGKRVFLYAGVYLINLYFSVVLLGYFVLESVIIFGYRFWVVGAANYLRSIDGCFLDRNIRNMMNDMETFIETEYLHKFLNETAVLMGICVIVGTVVMFCYVVLSKLRVYSISG